MNRGRRLLLVVACVCCLLAVAVALPSADPRIDALGSEDGVDEDSATNLTEGDGTTSGDPPAGDPSEGEREGRSGNSPPGDPGSGEDEHTLDIEFDGSLVPGTEREVQVLGGGVQVDEPVEVGGTVVGSGGNGTFTVPYDGTGPGHHAVWTEPDGTGRDRRENRGAGYRSSR